MKPGPQFLPPLQSLVYAYTRRVLDETGTNAQSFAMVVADRYLALTAPDVRTVPFKLSDDPAADMRNNAQILRRYMDGTVKVLPADLLDAWVLSLPEPYRSECERDMARRRGRYSVSMPEGLAGEDYATISDVMLQTSELVSEWGRAIANGDVDDAELRRLDNEGDDAIAALLRFKAYVRQRHAEGAK